MNEEKAQTTNSLGGCGIVSIWFSWVAQLPRLLALVGNEWPCLARSLESDLHLRAAQKVTRRDLVLKELKPRCLHRGLLYPYRFSPNFLL
jgi:hypothetical protein